MPDDKFDLEAVLRKRASRLGMTIEELAEYDRRSFRELPPPDPDEMEKLHEKIRRSNEQGTVTK